MKTLVISTLDTYLSNTYHCKTVLTVVSSGVVSTPDFEGLLCATGVDVVGDFNLATTDWGEHTLVAEGESVGFVIGETLVIFIGEVGNVEGGEPLWKETGEAVSILGDEEGLVCGAGHKTVLRMESPLQVKVSAGGSGVSSTSSILSWLIVRSARLLSRFKSLFGLTIVR